MFTKLPVPAVVTFTVIVQLPLAATVPLENDNEVAPAVGAKVGVPQPLVVGFGGFATVMPAGSGSVKL